MVDGRVRESDGPEAYGDASLIAAARREVERIERAPGLLGSSGPASADESPTWLSPGSDCAGFAGPSPDSFPGYQILKELHRGGQGVVYLAIQQATRRRVAIKVMKEGPFAGPADRARFDREVQILGQLKAPNIVAIHETGLAAGCHYFVTDYISGQALDAHVASRNLGLRDKLSLMQRICAAVNFAHVRGIIHRDLKPSNIRVDGKGEPHVLDFGLAKVTGEDGNLPAMTVTGQFLGSLPWASPEQAAGQPARIDLRTDVYSLGVILYQILTGTFPYEIKGTMRDVLGRIIEAEPARPRSYAPQIDDEVETILLKCLQKDPERRYQTAGELGRDIGHYLSGQPIEAKRDSGWYVLRKTLSRYRGTVSIAALSLVVTLAFGVSMSVLYRDAERSRREAERERVAAADQAEAAEAINAFFNEMLAAVDPMQLRSFSAYATPGFSARLSAHAGVPRDASVADLLTWAAGHVEEAFAGQPALEATARETIGMTWRGLGRYADAIPHLQRALEIRRSVLGEQHPDTLRSFLALGDVLSDAGRSAEAYPLVRTASNGMRMLFGRDDPRTMYCDSVLASIYADRGEYFDAECEFTSVLERQKRVLGPEHRDTLATMFAQSVAYLSQWKLDEGQALAKELYEITQRTLPPEDSLRVLARPLMGWWYLEQYRFLEAEDVLRPGLEQCRRILGDDHPFTFITMNGLARALQGPAHAEEREALHRAALEGLRRTRGPHHWQTISATAAYAHWLDMRGAFQQAEPLYRSVVADCVAAYGPRHEHTLTSMFRLANFLEREGKLDESIGVRRDRLEIIEQRDGPQAPTTYSEIRMLARSLVYMGRVDEGRAVTAELLDRARRAAETPGYAKPNALNNYAWFLLTCVPEDMRDPAKALPYAEQAVAAARQPDSAILDTLALACHLTGDNARAIEIQRKSLALLPPDRGVDVMYGANLVRFLLEAGDTAGAQEFIEKSITLFRRTRGDDTPLLAMEFNKAGAFLTREGYYSLAEAMLQEGLELSRRLLGRDNLQASGILYDLGDLYTRQARFDEAEEALAEALAIREAWLGREHQLVALTEHARGFNFYAAGRAAEAESQFRAALETYHGLGAENVPAALRVRCMLACILAWQDDFAAAKTLADAAWQRQLALFGPMHRDPALTNLVRGWVLTEQGHAADAEPLLRESLETLQSLDAEPQLAWQVGRAASLLGYCLTELGKYDEAERLLLDSYTQLQAAEGDTFVETRAALRRLVLLYERWNKPREADRWLRRITS